MLSEKKMAKLEKILGRERLGELEALSVDDLKNKVVAAESAIKFAQNELESNPKFQELKENLKALSEGMKEVKKHQKAVIDYAISLLEDKGQE